MRWMCSSWIYTPGCVELVTYVHVCDLYSYFPHENLVYPKNSIDCLSDAYSSSTCLWGMCLACRVYFVQRRSTMKTYATKTARKKPRGRVATTISMAMTKNVDSYRIGRV